MKKVISSILVVVAIVAVTVGYFIAERYQKNPEQIFPYPYTFKGSAPAIKLDAPVLVVGDRMGAYFAKFQAELAANVSISLSKPIKIQSIASNGRGIHRTLHELRSLIQWPQILIYQGASEEFMELKFNPADSKIIKSNFSLYQDDRVETALILQPWISRLVYEPHSRIALDEIPNLLASVNEQDYFQRLETELLLFEQQLIQLVNLSRDRGTLLILTTTPVNLDIPPKNVCAFTSTIDLEQELGELDELINANNPKAAYSLSSKLIKQYSSNAQLLFKHGQIAKRLGLQEEARLALQQATAYDCTPWRANVLFNSIIKRVAKNQKVIIFDFAKLVETDWNKNVTFYDEIYPQNLYYEQAMKQLGLLIKQILKL